MKIPILLRVSAFLLILTTFSCARTESDSGSKPDCESDPGKELAEIAFLIDEFRDETETKTSTVLENGSIIYAWEATDTIGIFPNTGYQVAFPIGSQAGDSYATFDGGGWALKDKATYSS